MEGVDGQPQQIMNHLGVEGSNLQDQHNMDQENHSIANPPFPDFNNPHVLQPHVQNPQHVLYDNFISLNTSIYTYIRVQVVWRGFGGPTPQSTKLVLWIVLIL